jgi:hypothetical protein
MSCSGEECDGRVIRQRTVGRAKRSEAARIEGSRTEDLTEDASSRVKLKDSALDGVSICAPD